MSCPFYGQCALPMLQATTSPGGNQCALVIEAFSPCTMEVHQGKQPDWDSCPRNTDMPGMRRRAETIKQWWAANEDGRRKLFDFEYPD
jgi:hypothetical protein